MSMFRFSIRELLLVTLVAAMGVAWRLDHTSQVAQVESCTETSQALQNQLEYMDDFLKWLGFTITVEGDRKYYMPPPILTTPGD